MKGLIKRHAAKRTTQAPPKRSRKEATDDDNGAVFYLNDDEDNEKEQLKDDEESGQETADQLRLRLAQEYILKLQGEEDGERDGVTGSDEEDAHNDEVADGGRVSLGTAARAQRLAERLQQGVAQGTGRVQRRLAHRVRVLAPGSDGYSEPCCSRGHRLSATAVALTTDDTTAYTVSKDGSICRWDVETMKRTQLYRPTDGPAVRGGAGPSGSRGAGPISPAADWVDRKARSSSGAALAAVAVSSDGKYLAVGGGDHKVHVFEAASGAYMKGFPGHKDMVTGLAFRDGTHTLASCSADRTVKLWSMDDQAYMETLYGHQAEVLAVDFLRAERLLTAGHDHTCRIWKIPEESHLVFRTHDRALDCARFVTATEWLSGGCDGGLHLWSQMKKKPVFVVRGAHGPAAGEAFGAPAAGVSTGLDAGKAGGGGAVPPEHGWLTSVAVCSNSDLVASGAGDGAIRLWSVNQGKSGGADGLTCVGALPQRGFVNGLAIARSARFVLAAVGQEPRMGRWARDARSRNGLALHRLKLED
ncbi:hypothetical protein PLESTB_000954900 [Pleodorina starrii]|uniref:Uncharacterized protein n=1 Tax=Pleodorina starrii TaxID=330485 RepID=A0A9W6BNX0_9CHLO|nr:hypothetical protein PLESTM_001143700 [Pleodorina starrii]GLC55205.1 hypothetical protein PLESTB_000954900 [Pleodorina starrii]GLC71039.1 hypothetical protein PLESTF_001068300 [Pleodorina starrii]